MIDIKNYLNPQYDNYYYVWDKLSDAYEGERAIKTKTTKYLPPTAGMTAQDNIDPNVAKSRYKNYLKRAIYYNYFKDTILGMLGVLYSQPFDKQEFPTNMEYLKDDIGINGQNLQNFMTSINQSQLKYGRIGAVLDPTENGLKILTYDPKTILNWSSSYINGKMRLDYVLLDESTYQNQGLKYERIESYRLLALDENNNYYTRIVVEDELDELDVLNPVNAVYPKIKQQLFKEIPFVFINAVNLDSDISDPPLENLADICLHIYLGESDYRQFIYQLSQDTLFLSGFESDEISKITNLGAGSLLASTNDSAKATFIGVDSQGLSENRLSLENLHSQAIAMGIGLIDSSMKNESGIALNARIFIKTALLRILSQTACQGIQYILNIADEMINGQKSIVLEPNSDFSGSSKTADEIAKIWNSKVIQGLPLSAKSIHKELVKSGYTEKSFEEEFKK